MTNGECVKTFSRVVFKDMPWRMVAETEVPTVSISDDNYISLLGAVLNYFISSKTYPNLLWRTKITAPGSYQQTVRREVNCPLTYLMCVENSTTNATGHNYS